MENTGVYALPVNVVEVCMKAIWLKKINQLDRIISKCKIGSDEIHELYRKRELLEKAFNEVGK